MSHKTVLRYIELKSDQSDKGPAWIARVILSRSGRSIYFGRKAFRKGNGAGANCFDIETGEEYWISGVKKNGEDRHWAGSGKISIETSAVEEYLQVIGATELDRSKFVVIPDFAPPEIPKFHELENR